MKKKKKCYFVEFSYFSFFFCVILIWWDGYKFINYLVHRFNLIWITNFFIFFIKSQYQFIIHNYYCSFVTQTLKVHNFYLLIWTTIFFNFFLLKVNISFTIHNYYCSFVTQILKVHNFIYTSPNEIFLKLV